MRLAKRALCSRVWQETPQTPFPLALQNTTDDDMEERRQFGAGRRYQPLKTDDHQCDSAALPETSKTTYPRLKAFTTRGNHWKTVSATLTLFWVATTAVLIWKLQQPRHRLDVSGYICAPNGAIPDVARARGCEFDGLSFHWFPKEHTEDKDNVAILREFEDHGPWLRYLDKKGRYPIPADNLVLTSAYLTRREHIIHCKYALRQTHLWVTKGWDVPFNYNHTLHCTAYLVDTIMENPPADLYDITTHVTPFPEYAPIVHPYYPCEEEGITCVSW